MQMQDEGFIKRKLASIRKIASVDPIEGADNIELVHVDGWQCISKKGDFKPGDLCVYFEIDSFLPIRPQFEFLRKSSYKKMGDKEGFRLKTIRLRGKLSQGLALNISTFIENENFYNKFLSYGGFGGSVFGKDQNSSQYEYFEYKGTFKYLDKIFDLDLTDILEIEKYDPPIPAQLA